MVDEGSSGAIGVTLDWRNHKCFWRHHGKYCRGVSLTSRNKKYTNSWCQVRYTSVRIVASVCVVPAPYSQTRYDWIEEQHGWRRIEVEVPNVSDTFFLYVDAIARPVIVALGVNCFLQTNTRFCEMIQLHVWSRRIIYLLAFCMADQSVTFGAKSITDDLIYYIILCRLWAFACNALQIYLTNLKLQVLGWHFTFRICQVLLFLSFVCFAVLYVGIFPGLASDLQTFIVGSIWWVISCIGLLLQCVALCWAATKALLNGGNDETIRCSAYCLYLNGFLAFAVPILSSCSAFSMINIIGYQTNAEEYLFLGISLSHFPLVLLVLDTFCQVLGTLLLSGMIGPKGWERPMDSWFCLMVFSFLPY